MHTVIHVSLKYILNHLSLSDLIMEYTYRNLGGITYQRMSTCRRFQIDPYMSPDTKLNS